MAERIMELLELAELETARMKRLKSDPDLLPSERKLLIEGTKARLEAWRQEASALRTHLEVKDLQ